MAMAIEVYKDSIVGISPRISFSHDLREAETIPIENYPCRIDPDFDFDFAFTINSGSTAHQSSTATADELFSNGKILPTDLIKKESRQVGPQVELLGSTKKSLREYLDADNDSNEDQKPKQPFWKFRRSRSTGESLAKTMPTSRSFWKFKRCNSLDADKGLIGSLRILLRSSSSSTTEAMEDEQKPPALRSSEHLGRSTSLNCDGNRGFRSLYFLSRSNSTGSVPVPNKREHYQKQQSVRKATAKPSSPSSNPKGQFKKNSGSYYGKTTRISPILNIPSPYISRLSVDLFGFGSLFCSGKERRKRR